jgi:hypothetical protein
VLAEDDEAALERAFDDSPRGGKSKVRVAAKNVLELLNKANHERAADLLTTFA